MVKKSLLVLLSVILSAVTIVSSCSSDEEEKAAFVYAPDNHIYDDFVRDAKDEAATVYYEKWSRLWLLIDSDDNRYYFYLTSDNVDCDYFDSLIKDGVMTDGAIVKFDGKVYNTSDEWRNVFADWLDHACQDHEAVEYNGGYLPSGAEWLQYNSRGKAFVLMEPYTITKVE